MTTGVAAGHEFGDRHSFLARASTNASRSHSENLAHPLPPASSADGLVPIGYRSLEVVDLVGSYVRNARAALLHVHRLNSPAPDDAFLRALIDSEKVGKVVVSTEPRAVAIGERLRALGCAVETYSREAAIDADLGVTSPAFGIAAIGSLVQDCSLEGSRGASLVPRVHLAVLPTDRIVGTTADVLSTFASHPDMPANRNAGTPADVLSNVTSARRRMPANIVLISGPSRTGDIEMILTIGVHGPVKVIVCVVDP